jgi:hypothetical protein
MFCFISWQVHIQLFDSNSEYLSHAQMYLHNIKNAGHVLFRIQYAGKICPTKKVQDLARRCLSGCKRTVYTIFINLSKITLKVFFHISYVIHPALYNHDVLRANSKYFCKRSHNPIDEVTDRRHIVCTFISCSLGNWKATFIIPLIKVHVYVSPLQVPSKFFQNSGEGVNIIKLV